MALARKSYFCKLALVIDLILIILVRKKHSEVNLDNAYESIGDLYSCFIASIHLIKLYLHTASLQSVF